MAFSGTYAFVLARAIDVLCASFIWRKSDITISSWCGLERRKPKPRVWARLLGWFLNMLQPGHCEKAISDDIARAREALRILGAT